MPENTGPAPTWRDQPETTAATARFRDLDAALRPGGPVAEAELALRGLHPVTIAHGVPEQPEEQELLYTAVAAWAREDGHLTSTRGGSQWTTYLFNTAATAAAFHARVTAAAPSWWRVTATATPVYG